MVAAAKSLGAEAPAAHTVTDRLIDRDHLIRQCLGDPGLEVEILQTFDTMIGTYARRLETTTRRDDVLMLLHTIRGAAAGIGANPLAALARGAEQEFSERGVLPAETTQDVILAIEELRVHIARVLSAEDDETGHLTPGA